MSVINVAVVQQRSRVYETPEEYQDDVKRFMRQVKSKHADIVVFPELSGLMLAYPLISGLKRGLLKRASKGSARRASPLSKILGRVAGTTADALGSGMQGSLERLLRKRHGELFDAYVAFFSDVAAEYGMYVVGGSVYLYDPDLDEIYNSSYLFDPNGEIVGSQEKLVLNRQDEELCSAGERMQLFSTAFGQVGVIVGSDVLYPEPARALAVQGADLLVVPAACAGDITYRQVRAAFEARLQENQLYGAISFLVGPNPLGSDLYAGKSAVAGPIEMTPRYTGLFQEVGADNVEGFVAHECDLAALHDLQETSDPPLRHRMPAACGPVLAGFYEAGGTIAQGYQVLPPSPAAEEETAETWEPEEAVARVPVSVEPEGSDAVVEEVGVSAGEEWPFEGEMGASDLENEAE
jgi:predicted amidohydrolase